MNKVILIGRLTRDPEVRYSDSGMAVGRYTLAVDRAYKREGETNADFIRCVCFGHSAEFAEKYLRKGTKIAVVGRLQTGKYTDRDGRDVYTTDVVVESQEFAESKASGKKTEERPESYDDDGFMNIPDGIDDELPFT